jgi:uncharacterized protein (DUF1015 family)
MSLRACAPVRLSLRLSLQLAPELARGGLPGYTPARRAKEAAVQEPVNEVVPFRALHYDPAKIPDIGLCLSQPYDVISPADQEAYYRRHPDNVIRLILGKVLPQDCDSDNRYTRARDLLHRWRNEGVLRCTQRPSFWILEQEFDLPEVGWRKVRGFIGLVRLQDYGSGLVRPHEKVMNRPLADRLSLTEATGTQFEYIWGLYRDEAYVIDNVLNPTECGDPILDCVEKETQVRHRLWRLTDAKSCGIIRRTMERLPIYIADGHHRYQAMLTHRDRMRKLHPEAGPEAPWEFIMMFLVNSRHEGLTVLPTHRLLHDLDLKRRGLLDLHLGILEHFHVKSYSFNGANGADEPAARLRWLRDLRDAEPGVHKFGALIAGMNRYFLITLKDAEAYEEMMEIEASSAWKTLDVNILNTLILNRIVGITEEELAAQVNVDYTKDLESALAEVRAGRAQVALILNPTRLEDIFTIADAGEIMPRKSTYFYPKPLSGLVLYPMEEAAESS